LKPPFSQYGITRGYYLSAVGFVASRSLTSSLVMWSLPHHYRKSRILAIYDTDNYKKGGAEGPDGLFYAEKIVAKDDFG